MRRRLPPFVGNAALYTSDLPTRDGQMLSGDMLIAWQDLFGASQAIPTPQDVNAVPQKKGGVRSRASKGCPEFWFSSWGTLLWNLPVTARLVPLACLSVCFSRARVRC